MKEKKTEILLVQQEKETGIFECIQGLFLLLLYFYMSVFGCVFGFLSVFEIPCDHQMLGAALLIFGGFFFVLCLLGKAGKIAIVLAAFVYGIFLWRFFDLLCEGGNVALQAVRQVVDGYWNSGNVQARELEIYGREGLVFLAAVIFPWSGILFSALVFRGGRMFMVVSMALVFSAALAVGKVPDFLPFCLMAGGLAGTFSTDGLENLKGQKAGAFLLTVFLLLLLAAGQTFLTPVLEPWFAKEDQIRESVQNTSLIQELRKRMPWGNAAWATAGIGNGELGNADFISSTNETVLKVTTDAKPEEMIYLRCYTGAEYTGKRWVESDDPEEERMREEYFDRILSLAEERELPGPEMMKIKLEEDTEEYDYMPYFSRLEEKQEGEYSYRYYKRKQIGLWSERWMLPFDLGEEYYGSIYEKYTSYPEEKLTRLREVCNSWRPDSLEGLRAFIVNYLEQNASYNLNVGRYPEDQDFVDYFLFEKHEGYCVHFATAATLMFRMYGVPARYATGYIVSAQDFKKDGQAYSASVKDSRAHAWTEVYMDGQGWVPVEVTPGYTHMEEEKAEAYTEEGNLRDSQAHRERETETETEPEKRAEGGTGILRGAFWICLLFLVFSAGIGGRRRVILKKKKKEGVREIFCDVCGVLALAGFEDDVDCGEEQYPEHVAERFSWLDKEAFSELVDLAMRANFGPEEMTEEEREFAWRMYQKICHGVYRELPAGKKLRFRFWDVFA